MPPKKVQKQINKKPTSKSPAQKPQTSKKSVKNNKVITKQTQSRSKTPQQKSNTPQQKSKTPQQKSKAPQQTTKSKETTKIQKQSNKQQKQITTNTKQQQRSVSPQPEKKIKENDKNIKKITFTGTAPVDEFVTDRESFIVYEQSGRIFDCAMNQTNIIGDNNNNKFYIVQLLKKKIGDQFYVFNRWGRVGVPGQWLLMPSNNLLTAIAVYEKKIHEKSVKGDYRILQKDYSDHNVNPKNAEQEEKKKEKKTKEAFDKSKLHQSIKELIRLIFDMKMINNQMKEIGYDAKKMPLGKLAPSTIKKGFDVLKQLSDELTKKSSSKLTLQTLTSEFYSQIPHDFGFQKAPLLDNMEIIKQKLDMLEAIQHIQVATKILEDQKDDSNIIDENFKKLNIGMKHLEDNDEKVKLIKQYVKNTQGNYNLEVVDVFELTKDQDDKRFKNKIGNRLLLWHGSRLTNFVGILGQGLRIAPPEAPVSGYRFGKGIYLADMIEKSADYCYPDPESKIGLALLCDSALGNQNIKLQSDWNANQLPKGKDSTWAKAKEFPPLSSYVPMPGMKDVQVPVGKPTKSDVANTSTLYNNEFIVYDVAQVRLKYLVKLKFKGDRY